MERVRNKMLLFAVRQLLGRIVKDIQSDQLETIKRSEDRLGFAFELSHLELNETFINQELLGFAADNTTVAAPSSSCSSLRLAYGYANSLRGNITFSPSGRRKLEVDGLQLVFDVIPKVECALPTGHRGRNDAAGNTQERTNSRRDFSKKHTRPSTKKSSRGGGVSGAMNAHDDNKRHTRTSHRHHDPQHHHRQWQHHGNYSDERGDDTMFSSLLMSGSLRRGVEEGVVVPAIRETGLSEARPSALRGLIDEGLDVFGRTIRQFMHSVSGCIRNVSIILRIPPLDQRIVPGRGPPQGTLELIISFQGGFELEDMCSNPDNDIMHKRIRFSNFRVAVYPYGKRHTTRCTEEEVEESVDLADVVLCTGAPEEFNNDIVVRFGEGRNATQGPGAFLNAKVTTRFFPLILSPTQLGRLVHVARALVGAPEGDREDIIDAGVAAATTASSTRPSSTSSPVVRLTKTIKATCQYVSCTFLPSEDQKGTKLFWQMLEKSNGEDSNENTLHSSQQHRLLLQRLIDLKVYYNVYVGGIILLVQPMTTATSSAEDAFHDVFQNHGGRGCSAGISLIEIYELYAAKKNASTRSSTCADADADTTIPDGGRLILTTKENTETSSERRYRIAIVSRTTYPLTLEEARRCNSDILKRDDHIAAVVMEHVLVKTSGAVVLGELDAGILERLGTFLVQLQRIIGTTPGSRLSPGYSIPEQQQQHHHHPHHRNEKHEYVQRVDASLSSSFPPHVLQQVSADDMDRFEKLVVEEQFTHLPLEQLSVEDAGDYSPEVQVTTPYVFLRFMTLQLEGTTVEMKFPTSKAPDPDYYGPLTRRLWEHLRKEGEALFASSAKTGFTDMDGPYLPLTMSVYLKSLDVSVDSEGVLEVFLAEGQITLHDYKEGVQSKILYALFDVEGKEPCISVEKRDSRKVCSKWGVAEKAHHPFTKEFETEETETEKDSFITVIANICKVEVQVHQDELLLPLFYFDQILETVDRLCMMMHSPVEEESGSIASTPKKKSNKNEEEEEEEEELRECIGEPTEERDVYSTNAFTMSYKEDHSVTTETDPIITNITIRLTVNEGTISLWAPRLSSACVSIGEPLWRCIPHKERRLIDEEHLYHYYDLTLSNVSLFALHQASSLLVKTLLHGRTSDFSFRERLCKARLAYTDFPWPAEHCSSPNWGEYVTLLQSYTAHYNRSSNVRVRPPRANATGTTRGRCTAGVSLCRHRNLEDHTEKYDVALQLDRICMSHQASHEGDHWLFVLSNFFSDVSTDSLNIAVAEKETRESPCAAENADVRSDDGVAIATSATVNIILIDALLEYRPFGRYSMLVCLVPRLDISLTIPSRLKETSSVKLYLRKENVSVFLHNSFQQYLMEYDRLAGVDSLIGSSEEGVAADLRNLGYVLVMDITNSSCVNENNNSNNSHNNNNNNNCWGGGGNGSGNKTDGSNSSGGYTSGVTAGNDAANIAVFINVTSGKPVFIEIQKLRAFMFFAHDSLYHFRTVVSHFLTGVDLLYLPSPYLLVQRSGPHFAHITHVNSNKNNATVTVHHLVPDYEAYVLRLLDKSVFSLCGETPEGNEEKKKGEATVKPNGPTDPFWDDFDIIHTSEITSPQTVEWITREDESIDLGKRCIKTSFLSLYGAAGEGPQVAGGPHASSMCTHRTRYRPRKTPATTPIAMELYLYDSDVIVHLYGGTDFVRADVPHSYIHTMQRFGAYDEMTQEPSMLWSGMEWDKELHEGRRVGNRTGFLGGGRHQDEYVVARFTGIRLQVDLFLPGKNNNLQVYLAVRDCEVLDCIESSSVRTMLMGTFPQHLRDHESDIFEIKWTTIIPFTSIFSDGIVVVGKPEEELIVRLQPITIALHRRAMNLLPSFLEVPDDIIDGNEICDVVEPQPLYFHRILVYPVQITLHVHFEGQGLSNAILGDVFELCNYVLPSLEGSLIQVPYILIAECPLGNVGDLILETLQGEILKLHGLFMLCCGVQLIQLVSNVSEAGADVLFAPLREYRRNKRFFFAISRAFHHFLLTVVSQSLHSAAVLSQRLQVGTSTTIAQVVPVFEEQNVTLTRGSQPVNFLDGLRRAFAEFIQGFSTASSITAYCLGPQGSLLRLPVAAPAVMDGFLRATIEILRGVRNSVDPNLYELEKKLFKGKRRKILRL